MATTTAPVQIISTEPEYHPEVTSTGIDHSLASAVKASRKGGKPANTITKAAELAVGTAGTLSLDQQVAALRKRYESADKGETAARARFEAADIDWQNARVIKVRVAYAAAMLTPNKGAANLLAATRYLLTDPNDTPAKRTAAAKSRKNTLRNYVAAGEALQEAGLASNITEPDENERKIVANVFRELNKRDKQEAADNKGEGDTPDKGEGEDTPANGDSLTVVDIVGHIARMTKTLELIKASGVVISEQEASNVADMLNSFTMVLSEYAADK